MRWWRLLTVPVALALVVVGGCVGGSRDPGTDSTALVVPPAPQPPLQPPARAVGPLVGAIQGDGGMTTELARLDPRTARPLPGNRLTLPGSWPMLAVSPDGSVAVLGGAVGDLTVVDLVSLHRLGTVRTDVLDMPPFAWGWVGRSRLLLVDTSEQGATRVLAVDVGARRIVARQRFDGVVQAYARLPQGLALLVAPEDAIGTARLVVAARDARLRTVTLTGIDAGFRQVGDGADGSDPRVEQRVPGIAADPGGRSVYVVPADGPVAEIDVATMGITYHRLHRVGSPLQRLAGWWAPAAEAKVVSGPVRSALWLGAGQLVVTGSDGSAEGQHVETPAGLWLIETTDWTLRRVDRHTGTAVLAGDRLLAFGAAFGAGPNGANEGYGLTVYGRGNRRPVHLFGAQQVVWSQVSSHYAYVQVMDANHGDVDSYAVIDLRSDRVLHRGQGWAPELLVPDRR